MPFLPFWLAFRRPGNWNESSRQQIKNFQKQRPFLLVYPLINILYFWRFYCIEIEWHWMSYLQQYYVASIGMSFHFYLFCFWPNEFLSLTCLHVFCETCLRAYFNHCPFPYKCPLCRDETEIPREDKSLKSLIEKVAFFLDHSLPPNTSFNQANFYQFF